MNAMKVLLLKLIMISFIFINQLKDQKKICESCVEIRYRRSSSHLPKSTITMASFSVSYTKEYNTRRYISARKGISLYEDWLRRGCPSKAAFTYAGQPMDNAYTALIYDPFLNALYIKIWYGHWIMTAIPIIEVHSTSKQLSVKAASCKAVCGWPVTRKTPIGIGGARFLRRSLNHVSFLGILSKVTKEFFGREWSFKYIRRGTLYDKKIADEMHDWYVALFLAYGIYNVTTAFYDTTKDAAATLIQAAFRGWKTRMKYRYNPYNRLGKYVALKSAGFI